jgi:hypothetical protein
MSDDSTLRFISVLHTCEDGWHKFIAPQIPGLYMTVESSELEAAYRDLPKAIERLIFVDTGRHVTITPEKSYDEYLKTLPESHQPLVSHYSVGIAA